MKVNVTDQFLSAITAHWVMDPTYSAWLEWKDSNSFSLKRSALVMKTRALIRHDKVLEDVAKNGITLKGAVCPTQ